MRKLSGPGLAGLGLAIIAAIALLPAARESPLPRWILASVLTPERVLPAIGLGVAMSLVGARAMGTAFTLFGFGIAVGFAAEDQLLRLLDTVPQAATHLFLTSPISYLAIGAVLVSSSRLRPLLVPIAALIFGVMLAVIIKLTDPSLHEPAYTWTPVLIAIWIVAATSLTLCAFWHGWYSIFGRILGSWLLAIGLLYGAASMVPRRELPPASPQNMPNPDRTIPGLPVPDQPGKFPGGIDRFRQP